ncbi:MAG: protein translocase subunit SecDF, partial [Flavisolibacter sp.]|nr:protein translocase subunit SecDF [Flavisolibacter sp.]
MQLKGLVRFFTILLILYSIYELSFTWVVRSHEKKMEAQAKQFVSATNPNLTDDQILDSEIYKSRLRRLLDSTKEVTVHYGINGAVSYQKAKEEELNLGLDLQGGINVTMEVELSGLLRAMTNNSKDPNFNKALENANTRKANSSADYITLFAQEYKKLAPNSRLAPLFATANQNRIKVTDNDENVISEIRREAYDAFDRTFRVLRTRIDQFGVAQPNINPDRDRGIITVELPGIQDRERVRKYLQSSANLEFWEVYKTEELQNSWVGAESAYSAFMSGRSAQTPSTTTTADTNNRTQDTTTTGVKLSEQINDTVNRPADTSLANQRSLMAEFFKEGFGYVSINDTAVFREHLNRDEIRSNFPADAMFAYGIPPRDKSNKQARIVPLYVLKTNNREKPPMEGSVITSSDQSFDQFGKPSVSMEISAIGSRQWESLTKNSFEQKRPIAILLDDVVYSAPIANNGPITGGRTEISGDFSIDEAKDLANILKAGKLPAPAKIVQEQVVGPTLGKDAI